MFHLEMNIGTEKFKEALGLLSSDETNMRKWIDFSSKVVTTKLNLEEREDGSRVITIEEIEKLVKEKPSLFIY